jgi:predicted RNase H-like nuclease (RuvC/YqgF family)
MNKKILIPIIAGAVLLIGALAFLGIRLSQANKANEEMVQLFELEKEEMENEYSTFATQYDEMQILISNDSLVAQLEREKLRTQQLLEELRATKASNAAEITRLKKELKTVRAVMRSYVVQIDSLNQVNEKLTKENKRVRTQYAEATKKVETLQEEAKNLSDKVTLAAQLDATNIRIEPRNKRGKATNSIKSVIKFAIDFTIVKNITAPTGERTIYVRIAKPDGSVLTKDASRTFKYENTQLEYSIKKLIEYTGEEQSVTVYWDVEEFLNPGAYTVYIFSDGVMIGEKSFTLEA